MEENSSISIESEKSDEMMLKLKEMIEKNPENNFFQQLFDKIELLEKENGLKRKMDEDATEGGPVKRARQSLPSLPTKRFAIKHTFRRVSQIQLDDDDQSDEENYFGTSWFASLERKKTHYQFNLIMNNSVKSSVEADIFIICVVDGTKRYGRKFTHTFVHEHDDSRDIDWHERVGFNWMNSRVVDDNLTVEIHIEIKKMEGVYRKNSREFDESMKKYSDGVMVVKDQKFYVDKKFLASQSCYFDGLLFGQFAEANQEEVTLQGVDPDDFQKYLEAAYNDPVICDHTVEGILHVAHFFHTPNVLRACETYLIRDSHKTVRKALELAAKYNLKKLRKVVLSSLKSAEDVKDALPDNIQSLHPIVATDLLEKLADFV